MLMFTSCYVLKIVTAMWHTPIGATYRLMTDVVIFIPEQIVCSFGTLKMFVLFIITFRYNNYFILYFVKLCEIV